MSSNVISEGSKFDLLKWVLVLALVAVAVVGNSIYSDQSLFYRIVAILVVAGIAGFVALQTAKGKAFFTLFKEARAEIRKVVWPTRQETGQTTAIVVVAVLIIGLLLWGLDSLLSWLVAGVIG